MSRIIILLFVCSSFFLTAHARKSGSVGHPHKPVRVLLVGAPNNVKSNYYYDELIAEQISIPVDSIEWQFNQLVALNLEDMEQKAGFDFILLSPSQQGWTELTDHLEVTGEGQSCSSDLANLSTATYQDLLLQVEADYLLVLNQHYLKWQEQPMRTLFHILSYSIYDKNKQLIYSGNEFFTSMKLEKLDRMAKSIKKPSEKIGKELIRLIQQ